MIGSYQTKRITSFFVVIFLVISLMFNCISVVSATETITEKEKLPLNQYSFLETVCSMFNFIYLPEEYIIGDLVTWSDIGNCSSYFNFLLNELELQYVEKVSAYGYQTTNPELENYTRPHFYYPVSSSYPSIYNTYLSDGCLDFSSSLNENEFTIIRESINSLFKLMYDYNHNLSDYTIEELAYSVPYIKLYLANGSWFIGYNIPNFYGYTESNLDWGRALQVQKDWIDSYSSSGFGVDDYIFMLRPPITSNGHLVFNLVSTNIDSPDVSEIDFSLNVSYKLNILDSCTFHGFRSATDLTTSGNTTENYVNTIYVDGYSYNVGTSQQVFISPLLDYYTFKSYSLPNWGRNMVVGSADAWSKYSSFTHTSEQNIYYPPSLDDMNLLISTLLNGGDPTSIVNTMSGVDTSGTKTPVVDEKDEFVFDYEYIDKTVDDAIDKILNSGDYKDVNESISNMDDIFNQYGDAEDQLKDFTNLDSVVDTLWNTNNLLEHATSISSVSTWFMTLWDAFGPYVIIFSLALALGLVAFLLKLRN